MAGRGTFGRSIQHGARELREMARETPRFVADARNAPLRDMANDASRAAPKQTGELASSIHTENGRLSGSVYSNCIYAPVHEFGGWHPVFGRMNTWVYQTPQPFFVKSVVRNIPNLLDSYQDSIVKLALRAGYK